MRSIASLNLFCSQYVNTVDVISKSVLHIQTELEAYLRTNDKILKISFIYPPKILSHLYKLIFNRIHLKPKDLQLSLQFPQIKLEASLNTQ